MTPRNAITILVFVGGTAAISSSLNFYPNVSLQITTAPEFTQLNTLFIYKWPAKQERCPGMVIAVEYCFQRVDSLSQPEPIFTLLLLELVNDGYRVSQRIDVLAQNFSFCSNLGGIDTCCERRSLEKQNQFMVPSGNIAFGIYSTGRNRILAFRPEQENGAIGFKIPVQPETIQRGLLISVSLNNAITIAYRMFSFVIDADNGYTTTYTTSSMTIPTSSTSPPNTIVLAVTVAMCIVTLLFIAMLVLWLCTCCRYRRLQKRTSKSDKKQHIYESVSKTTTNEHLPKLFTLNPAYGCRQIQPEPHTTMDYI